MAADTNTGFTTVEGMGIKGAAMLVIKTDPKGHIGADVDAEWLASGGRTWAKLYDNQVSGPNTNEQPFDLGEDADSYIVLGYGWHTNGDGHILKINKTNGDILKQKRYGTPHPGHEWFFDLAVVPGGYAITGMADSYGPGGTFNALFMKLDSTNLMPVTTGKAYDQYEAQVLMQRGYSIKPTSSGYALAVFDESLGFLLLQTDSDGNLNWSSCKRYGVSGAEEYSTDLAVTTNDPGIVLGGYASDTYLGVGGYNWLIVKVNSAGGLTCATDISGDPINLSQTDFTVTEILDASNQPIPLQAATILPAYLDDINVGPGASTVKIFQTSAAGIANKDNCQ